jgi:hypothetical protein
MKQIRDKWRKEKFLAQQQQPYKPFPEHLVEKYPFLSNFLIVRRQDFPNDDWKCKDKNICCWWLKGGFDKEFIKMCCDTPKEREIALAWSNDSGECIGERGFTFADAYRNVTESMAEELATTYGRRYKCHKCGKADWDDNFIACHPDPDPCIWTLTCDCTKVTFTSLEYKTFKGNWMLMYDMAVEHRKMVGATEWVF